MVETYILLNVVMFKTEIENLSRGRNDPNFKHSPMAIMGKPIFVGTFVVSLAIKPCCAVNIEHLLILIGFNA